MATLTVDSSDRHRSHPAAQTLEWLRPLLPALGITRLANVTGLDRIGMPVVMVCRPASRSLAVTQGKGLTLEQAKVSGLMEAIEGFHGERIDRPLRFASAMEMRERHTLVDVERLPLSRLGRFDAGRKLLWIEGRELDGAATAWLPYELVSTDYSLPQPPGSGCFVANSNGLAAGRDRPQAIVHGLCELIERDAVTLWKLASEDWRESTSLDPASVDDPPCRSLLERFDRAGVETLIWEVSSDLGIACFHCLLIDRRDEVIDPEFGAGCHPERGEALLRALTEAAQARVTFITGSRDDLTGVLYAPSMRQARRQAALRLRERYRPARMFQSTPDHRGTRIEAGPDWIVARLRRAGLDHVWVVDLEQAAIGIPVVKVVVPGLEGALQGPGSDYQPGVRGRQMQRRGGW